MYKLSPLNSNFKKAIFVINEETISLGNSDNSSTVFRKHKFTVIRPNLLAATDLNVVIDEQPLIKPSKFDGFKKMIAKVTPTTKLNPGKRIDISLIPDYVLVNPSEWGILTKYNKDGSAHDFSSQNDTLLSLKKFISFTDEQTISIKFNLKESNV